MIVFLLLVIVAILLLGTDAGKRVMRGAGVMILAAIGLVLVMQQLNDWQTAGYINDTVTGILIMGGLIASVFMAFWWKDRTSKPSIDDQRM